MIIKNKDRAKEIKSMLFEHLKEENAFWSYLLLI